MILAKKIGPYCWKNIRKKNVAAPGMRCGKGEAILRLSPHRKNTYFCAFKFWSIIYEKKYYSYIIMALGICQRKESGIDFLILLGDNSYLYYN